MSVVCCTTVRIKFHIYKWENGVSAAFELKIMLLLTQNQHFDVTNWILRVFTRTVHFCDELHAHEKAEVEVT